MNPKALILGEMLALYAGSLVNEYSQNKGDGWTMGIVSKTVLRKALAVVALLALLTLIADLGAGGLAAGFGALVVLGYLISIGAGLGQTILDIENEVFAQ